MLHRCRFADLSRDRLRTWNARAHSNPVWQPELTERGLAALERERCEHAYQSISSWPNYRCTPIHPLTELATELSIASLHYKDESTRFGLGSFKALGGAHAVAELVRNRIFELGGAIDENRPIIDELSNPQYAAARASLTVCCATDGNHGRSVAWGAQLLGVGCVIFLHETVSQPREDAIARYGARIVRCQGNYDDAVKQADVQSQARGWMVVSDTSYPGYTDIPRDVMAGYSVMATEVMAELGKLGELGRPTHVFLQTGVGSMAATVARVLLDNDFGTEPIRIVLVDPENAACWWKSIRHQAPTAVDGSLHTQMAGLACGEVSLLAWDILAATTHSVMSLHDAAAFDCMRLLATPDRCVGTSATAIVAGESAVAGLAGAIAACRDPDLRAQLEINDASRILTFGTEGDTDPEIYQSRVGESADSVRAAD